MMMMIMMMMMMINSVMLYLQDLVFYFTPGVQPSKSVLSSIVVANGGHLIDSLHQLNSEVNKFQTFFALMFFG